MRENIVGPIGLACFILFCVWCVLSGDLASKEANATVTAARVSHESINARLDVLHARLVRAAWRGMTFKEMPGSRRFTKVTIPITLDKGVTRYLTVMAVRKTGDGPPLKYYPHWDTVWIDSQEYADARWPLAADATRMHTALKVETP